MAGADTVATLIVVFSGRAVVVRMAISLVGVGNTALNLAEIGSFHARHHLLGRDAEKEEK